MQFKNDTLEPLYKLLIGKSGESNALWISKKMGIRDSVLERAKRYIQDKDYNFEKIKDSKVKKEIENIDELLEDKKEVKFNIGDKVLLLDYKKSGIVYKEEDDFNNVTVFYNKEFIKVHISRLKLEIKATELYPEGYDLSLIHI